MAKTKKPKIDKIEEIKGILMSKDKYGGGIRMYNGSDSKINEVIEKINEIIDYINDSPLLEVNKKKV